MLNQYLVERSSTGDYVSGKTSYRTAPTKRKAIDPKILKEGFMAHHYQFVLRPSEDFMLESTPIRAVPSVARLTSQPSAMPPLDYLSTNRTQQMTVGLETALKSLDSVLNWDYILFVTVSIPIDEYTCPICLDQPTVPRMTSCGHIFCFSCILRSMNSQKSLNPQEAVKKRTCPMCSSNTGATELRPVIYQVTSDHHPQPGREESFTLVCRHKDAAAVVLGDAYTRASAHHTKWLIPTYGSDDATFSRYCFATEGLLEQHFEQEVRDLQRRLDGFKALPRPLSDDDTYEYQSLDEALQLLLVSGFNYSQYSEHKQSLLRRLSPLSAGKFPSFEESNSGCMVHTSSVVDAPSSPIMARMPAQSPVLWFYQSSDGSKRYLHSLNRRMLRREYKTKDDSLPQYDGSFLPDLLTAPVIAVLSPTQDADTKATDLHTAHVPLGSTLTCVYVDLSGIVSDEVMDAFRGECEALEHRLHMQGVRERAAEDEASYHASMANEAAQARSSKYGFRGTFSQHYVPTEEEEGPGDELTAEELAWLTADGVPTPSQGSSPSLKSKQGPIDVEQLPELSSLNRGDGHSSCSSAAQKGYDTLEQCAGGSSLGASTLEDHAMNHGSQRQTKRIEAIVAADRQRVSSEVLCPPMTSEHQDPSPLVQDANPFAVLQAGRDTSQWAHRAATSDYNRLHGAAVPHAKPSWAGRPMKNNKDN